METTPKENPYPEILKFCSWYKKETDEKGLQYLKVSIPGLSNPEIARCKPVNQLTLHGFERLFERVIILTPEIIEGVNDYINSSSCRRTYGFERFEASCAEWNRVNVITTTVERPDVF